MHENKKNLSEREAADRLGVSRLTLWRARQRGEIAFLRIGRRVLYSETHINEFEERHERAAAGGERR
jgi:excisionase family DNA binding protein